MTPWELVACIEGWNRHHGENKPAPPTDEEFDEALRKSARVLETMH